MKIKKSHLKELVKQSIIEFLSEEGEEEKENAPEKEEKPMTNIEDNPFEKEVEEGGPGSGRPTKAGSKRDMEKRMDAATADANARLDAAEKAMKKKKKKVKESKQKRYTVKEVKIWMKTLEENRYKKTYNSDCRRVAWMVNNEGVELSEMPVSMAKKWSKAQYGRERYLATEFLKSKKQQMAENKLRSLIRKVVINEIRGVNEKKKKL